jgi:hypothetical protein
MFLIIIFITNLLALEFQVRIIEPIMKEGEIFQAEISYKNKNDIEINQILQIKEKQVHKNLYLVEVNLVKDSPVGTFIATTERKTAENYSITLSNEVHVTKTENENFIYEKIKHSYISIPNWLIIIIFIVLTVLTIYLKKIFKIKKLRMNFESSQKKFYDTLIKMSNRENLEGNYQLKKIAFEYFDFENKDWLEFEKYLNQIQYKEKWSDEELKICQDKYKKFLDNLKQKKYGI